MRLVSQVAIVTGGASGLGAATAQLLTQHQMHVFVFDLAHRNATAPRHEHLTYLDVDVTQPNTIETALQTVQQHDNPLRVVVNCAGVSTASRILSKHGTHDLEEFARTININLVGTFNVMTLAAQLIADQHPIDDDGQRGVVINTASIAAFEGQIGQTAYAASKGGVHALTLPAARDLATYGIRVNTIAPGIVDTPMMANVTPEIRETLEASVPFPARLARPEEYAQLVLNVIQHGYLNGQTVRMDGALRMGPR